MTFLDSFKDWDCFDGYYSDSERSAIINVSKKWAIGLVKGLDVEVADFKVKLANNLDDPYDLKNLNFILTGLFAQRELLIREFELTEADVV